MTVLYVGATTVYWFYGIQGTEAARTFVDTLYFSIVTFTTSPPIHITVEISKWAAMVETFLGTLMIVLLGYVLGNREQV
jgi:hypothetical protein